MMKTSALLLIAFLFQQTMSFSQADTVKVSQTGSDTVAILKSPQFSSPLESNLINTILYRYERARKMNIAGIAMGATAHVTLFVNSNFLATGYFEDYIIFTGTLGEAAAVTRLSLAGATIHQLNMAQKELDKLRLISGNENKFENSLKSLRTAKSLTVSVSVLGAAGLGLMICYTYIYPLQDKYSTAFFAAAWACAAAGLVTSVVSQIHIVRAMKVFRNESGSVNLGMSKNGIGICYSF